MLTAIVRASLRFPGMVVFVACAVFAYGAWTVVHASYDVFPDFVPPQADVQVEAPGLAPEEVERIVTQPLENAISGGAHIAAVRSESIQGLAAINVVFDEGSDVFRDRQLLGESVSEAASSLPPGLGTPRLGPMTSSTMDLLKIGLASDTLSGIELRTLVDYTVRPRMLAVPGVARAVVYGGGRREIQVEVHPQRLLTLGLSLDDVVNATTAATGIRGAGFVDTAGQRVLLANTAGRTPEEIAEVAITRREGSNVRLGDVATVRYAAAPAFGDSQAQGHPDVLMSLGSQYGANTLEVTRRVEDALQDLRPMLEAQGVTIYPALHRPANFIETALRNMRDSLLLGAFLIALVLYAFLRNWRAAVVSFVTIPLSLLIAIIVMQRFGWTINTMTLGGLAVAVGLVVDDAIIDVENIVRRLRLAAGRAPTARDAVVLGASLEVRRPIVLADLVVAMVFVPILLLPGLAGSFFGPLASAFLLATFASLVVALTLTPALALLLMAARVERADEARWLRRLRIAHHRTLRWAMPHARALLATSLLLGLLAILLATRFGAELMPPFREGHFVAQVTGPAGISLEEMMRLGARISRRLLEIPGIATVSQQVGRAEAGEDTWGPNRSEFHIELKPGLQAAEEIRVETALRDAFAEFPGIDSEVLTFLGDRISESVSGDTAAVTVNVFGPDLDEIDRTAAQAADVLRSVPGAADVLYHAEAGVPMITIRPRAERLGSVGMRPNDIANAVAAAYDGVRVSQVYDGNQAVDVRVLLAREERQDPESVGGLLIRTPPGRVVPLSMLADVTLESGRGIVLHESGQRRQVVTLNPTTRDLVGFVATAQAALKEKLTLPNGVFLEIRSAAEEAQTAGRQLLLNGAIAGLLVIMLMTLAFRDRRAAVLVLANVPFGLVGGVVAVALTGASLSIGSLVGFVTLFGICARNTILLISHFEHLIEVEGAPPGRATALRAARERLVPILMTALMTALGLLPLALGSGEAGREVEGPMAIVILGGLISSTILNLIVMPALVDRYLRVRASDRSLADATAAFQ